MRRETASDIVAVLLADHGQMEHRLEMFRRAPEEATPESLRALVSLLVAHETAEELIVYPVVRRQTAGGDAIAEDRLKEQTQSAHLLRDLEKTPFGEADFWYLVDQLVEAVVHHARSEEQSFFRELASSVEAGERHRMARHYEKAMRAAPTHPHPLSPHSPPIEAAVTPAVALVDRVRDRWALRHSPGEGADSGEPEGRDDGDVVSLLSHDHRALSTLARQLEAEAERTPKSVLASFSARLAAHTAVELEVIYPALQHASTSDQDLNIVKQGRLDHEEMALSLVRLQKVVLDTNEFRRELAHLVAETRLHIQQDENEVFPRLDILTTESRQELARQLVKAQHHVPRQPHPRTLKSGVGSKVANRLLSLIDKRPALHNR